MMLLAASTLLRLLALVPSPLVVKYYCEEVPHNAISTNQPNSAMSESVASGVEFDVVKEGIGEVVSAMVGGNIKCTRMSDSSFRAVVAEAIVASSSAGSPPGAIVAEATPTIRGSRILQPGAKAEKMSMPEPPKGKGRKESRVLESAKATKMSMPDAKGGKGGKESGARTLQQESMSTSGAESARIDSKADKGKAGKFFKGKAKAKASAKSAKGKTGKAMSLPASDEPLVGDLACGSVVSGTTAGKDPISRPVCGTSDGTGGAVSYSFVGTGNTVSLSTCNEATGFDTKIRVYRSSDGSCVVGQDDDSDCSSSTLQTTVSFLGEAGIWYDILVHGFSNSER